MKANIYYRGRLKTEGKSKLLKGGAFADQLGNVYVIPEKEAMPTPKLYAVDPVTVEQMICFDKREKPVFPGDLVTYKGVEGRLTFLPYEVAPGEFIPAWTVEGVYVSYDANLTSHDMELVNLFL